MPTYNDSGFVDLSIYIKSTSESFALANCTFPVIFDTTTLKFSKLLGSEQVMFNSDFNYNELDNDIPTVTGYLTLRTAPTNNTNAYNDIRSIEVDYDATNNIGGIEVPTIDTYLGTLRFVIKENANTIQFQ